MDRLVLQDVNITGAVVADCLQSGELLVKHFWLLQIITTLTLETQLGKRSNSQVATGEGNALCRTSKRFRH